MLVHALEADPRGEIRDVAGEFLPVLVRGGFDTASEDAGFAQPVLRRANPSERADGHERQVAARRCGQNFASLVRGEGRRRAIRHFERAREFASRFAVDGQVAAPPLDVVIVESDGSLRKTCIEFFSRGREIPDAVEGLLTSRL